MNLGARAREVNLKGRAYFLRIVGGGVPSCPHVIWNLWGSVGDCGVSV